MTSSVRFALISLLVGLLLGGAYFFLGSAGKRAFFTEEQSVSARATALDTAALIGDAAAKSAGKRLLEALSAKIASAGAAGAITFCREAAPVLTAEAAAEFEEQGVAFIKRIGVRVRAPGNAPGEKDRVLLQEMADEIRRTGKATPRVVFDAAVGSATTAVYYRPIMTDGLCIACHGPVEGIAPDVREALTAAYPGDEAVNFQPGDLRGVFAVGIELPPGGFAR